MGFPSSQALLLGARTLLPIAVGLLTLACAATEVALAPEAMGVRIGTNPPHGPNQELGAITAQHGGGCGAYGTRGNYEGAYAILKNKAASLGANYVQILQGWRFE